MLFFFTTQSCLGHLILTFFVNHTQKFKLLAEIMSHAKVDCQYLNLNSEGLIERV